MHKSTKALQFSKATKKSILDRDKGCLFCRLGIHMDGSLSVDRIGRDCMHIVNKSQMGLGVLENGVEGCRWHHNHMDNGKFPELREIAEDYLKSLYPWWSRDSVTYNKYKNLVVYKKER